MRVLAVADDIHSVISEIRLGQPLAALARKPGWVIELRSMHDCRLGHLDGLDVLVMQRGMSRRALALLNAARRKRAAVVYELDDQLLEADPHLSVASRLRSRRRWIERCLAGADVVTVTTPRLRDALLPYARCIRVVPNGVPLTPTDSTAMHDDSGRTALILASSDRLSAAFLLPVLRAMAQGGARLVAIGPPGEWLAAAGLPVERHPVMPRERFLALCRSLPNPVALIPLEDTPFAACKSAIKWFDFSTIGIPVICSKVSPYVDVMRDDVTGTLVPNDALSWERAIRRAIGEREWRERIAGAAISAVEAHHGLDRTVDAWEQALVLARQQRDLRGVPERSLIRRQLDALREPFDDLFVWARGLNRLRLARRKASNKGL